MDIKKITQETVSKMVEENALEKIIKDSIKDTISATIKDSLTSYDFRKEIKSKIKDEVSSAASELDFGSFKQLFLDQMLFVIKDLQGKQFAELARTEFESVFNAMKDSYTLSEILEAGKGDLAGLRDEWELQGEYFYLEFEIEGSFVCVNFGEESCQKSYDWQFRLMLSKIRDTENKYKAFSVKADSVKWSNIDNTISNITGLSKFQKLLLNIYFNKSTIVLDCGTDADYYDTSLSEDY